MILIPEGDAEASPLSLPAPGCSWPVPQAFPRSAACQALRGLVISCQRPRRGLLRPCGSGSSPGCQRREPCQGSEPPPARLSLGSPLCCQPQATSRGRTFTPG